MKHKKLYMFVIFILTIFMLWYLLKDHYIEIWGVIKNANYLYIGIAILMYIIYLFFDVLVYYHITKLYKDGITIWYQMYVGIVGKFFSGITPLASGGQPMQIYELTKKGVSVSNGTNIAIQSYMVFQVSLMILATIAIIINKTIHLFKPVPILAGLTTIGFIINFGILIILLCISFSKNFNRTIVKFFINILSKLKIVKDKEESLKKWNERCDEYYKNAQVLIQHKRVLFKSIMFEIASLVIGYMIPLVLAYALGFGNNIAWYATLSASSYIFIMGCYVPIPGATGGMEYAFTGFFGNFVFGYQLNTFVVIWRFITYYLPVIAGAIFFNINHNRKKLDTK